MNDRQLGYGVIIFLILFSAIITGYLSVRAVRPVYYRTIVFDSANSLNFLKKQDPVRLRGADAGVIRDIFLKEGRTHITIKTWRPIDIHEGYRVIGEAKGFMGDRYIEIDPGDTRAPAIDVNEPLSGIFPLGPTEAIAYTAELQTKVRSLMALTNDLKNGSSGKKPLDAGMAAMIKKIDSICAALTRHFSKADRFVSLHADSLASALEKADTISRKLKTSAPAALFTLDNSLKKTRTMLAAADSLAASSTLLLEQMKTWEAGSLSNEISRLRRQIETLRDFINEVQEHGLRLPVTL